MANPITNIKRKELPKEVVYERNLREVSEALSENKDAILKGIDLLATVNRNGTLDMMNAFVKHKEDALENIMQELNKPQYSATLENLSKLFLYLGELEMNELHYFTEKLNRGMEEARQADSSSKTSYMNLIKSLKDPEINRSITMLLKFLRGMGRD
ncbi:DUF1641 domain-containing protein [Virgibacillus ndiopensis]|uniref:DUF1641 domain-containing protein n=1 Tax=Virgibacillus ndiopensis TaxID=2004408 RepID=UPI000C08A335|nr:DUF1641 domain-containing protein [Virgibacillus ndiopensis]